MGDIRPHAQEQDVHLPRQGHQRGAIIQSAPGPGACGRDQHGAVIHRPANPEKAWAIAVHSHRPAKIGGRQLHQGRSAFSNGDAASFGSFLDQSRLTPSHSTMFLAM